MVSNFLPHFLAERILEVKLGRELQDIHQTPNVISPVLHFRRFRYRSGPVLSYFRQPFEGKRECFHLQTDSVETDSNELDSDVHIITIIIFIIIIIIINIIIIIIIIIDAFVLVVTSSASQWLL